MWQSAAARGLSHLTHLAPSVPDVVHADAWPWWVDGEHGVRQVNRHGFVKVDLRTYDISSKVAGQLMTLRINATERCLQVVYPQGNPRLLPLKGLYQRSSSYQDSVELMQQEASTRASLACFAEAANSTREVLLSLARCWETAPLTRLGSHTPLFQQWERHLSHQGRLDELFLLVSDSTKAGEDQDQVANFTSGYGK